MGQSPDVLVIGGGIIGLTSAYVLAKVGLSVEVVDRQDLGREASWAGAGIIPPGNPDRAVTPIDKLRGIGSRGFPALSAELFERTGIRNGFRMCGGVEFLSPGDEYAIDLWRIEGVAFERLDSPALRDIEPFLVPPTLPAHHLPGCGQVRNPWHMRALVAACASLGVRLRPQTPVLGWETDSGRVAGVRLADSSVRAAGRYLVASGAWGEGLLDPLGCRPGVRPVRGQIVLFRHARNVLTRVVMMGKRYLVPRGDGRILVGSTEEPEAGFEKATTPAGVGELREFALGMVPILSKAETEAEWAGLRPGSPDGLPFIGPVPGWDNVFAAVGHFRAGIQLSIGTADLVADLILGREPAVPADAFRLDREPDLTAVPAFRS